MRVSSTGALLGLLASVDFAAAQFTLTNSSESIQNEAHGIVEKILQIYYNNASSPAPGFIPGLFPEPYYWWEAGLAFDSLINYWAHSEDNTVVDLVRQAMVFQVGPDLNYMPPNQSKSEGNDDQSSWALAAMTAAEHGFPEPTSINATWAQLAMNVFDSQVMRWDADTCDGGFRWQVFTFNAGYNYKNSQTQANFAQLGARLFKYTGNSTYLDWAQRAVEWSFNIGLIDGNRSAIYDGTSVTQNCSEINRIQWTINAGQFMSAYAYACSEGSSCTKWWSSLGLTTLSSTANDFTQDNVLYEPACAPSNNCNVDQLAFRAPLARALANVRDMVQGQNTTINGTASSDEINEILSTSADSALRQCANNTGILSCGSDWTSTQYDGKTGLGQQLSVLETLLALLPKKQLNTMNSTTNGTATTGSGNGTSTGSGSSESSTAAANGAAGSMPSMLAMSLVVACFVPAFFLLL